MNHSRFHQGCAKDQVDPIYNSLPITCAYYNFSGLQNHILGAIFSNYILQMFAVLYLVFYYVPNVPLVF